MERFQFLAIKINTPTNSFVKQYVPLKWFWWNIDAAQLPDIFYVILIHTRNLLKIILALLEN